MPQIVKYKTSKGIPYIYDAAMGEIVRVNNVIYTIISDIYTLSLEDITKKYNEYPNETIKKAVSQISELSSHFHVFTPKQLTTALPADRVEYDNNSYTLPAFIEKHRLQLVLGVTENCNLDCKYCTFGDSFNEYTSHGTRSIDLTTAQSAVTDFLNNAYELSNISFYGGEPLLEFGLIKKIVQFAERYAILLGKRIRFSFTTNGTLLNKEIIAFIVEHNINIMISLDGDKKTHDTNRIFRRRNSKLQESGSFDIVIKNIQLFSELYPQYENRGLKITLTSNTDLHATNELLKTLLQFFPLNNVSFVMKPISFEIAYNQIPDDIQASENKSFSNSCDSLHRSEHTISMSIPLFIDYSTDFQSNFTKEMDTYLTVLKYDAQQAKKSYPLFHFFWNADITALHRRHLGNDTIPCYINYKCIPGVVKLYCDPEGNYYPCEKTERSHFFQIGNVNTGVDVENAIAITERMRLIADCGNCVARRICRLCLAHIHIGTHEKTLLQYYCRQVNDRFKKMLIEYTEVMESNASAFDDHNDNGDVTFLSKIRFKNDIIDTHPRTLNR